MHITAKITFIHDIICVVETFIKGFSDQKIWSPNDSLSSNFAEHSVTPYRTISSYKIIEHCLCRGDIYQGILRSKDLAPKGFYFN